MGISKLCSNKNLSYSRTTQLLMVSVVAVLFNLPDYLFVSSYLLVVLLWAETYQSSRRHWFSAEQFHRRWMIFYLIFNGMLYLTQVVLYALLFLRADPSAIAGIYENDEGTQLALVPTLIFDCVAAADLCLPLIILTTWIYLTLTLSGFPYKSHHAQAKLAKVLGGTYLLTQSMLLVALFVAAEILPIYILIDADLLRLLSMDAAYEQIMEP
ncbi:hypothetical protein DYB32_000799 [Aphanomyces invadans]|uniref:THH1/TOM1/TOM3 domain-containing protein n=1 Tax=Aphanomyces invadans TaxID=157072 RepID=A0A418B8X7_9STRA|nr:hypothetical protein DYB32_000799 [Aphanomyces invadans]